jgi:hypothetical protein
MKLSVHDVQMSSLPKAVGLCASDLPSILSGLNEVIQRLLVAQEMGDTGWYGTNREVVFSVNPLNPYVTTPREVARLSDIDICGQPIKVQNQYFEYLLFGDGHRPRCRSSICQATAAYDRGTVVTWVDIPLGNTVRVYPTNAADKNKRVFIQGSDSNGNPIYTIDDGVQVNGFFISLDTPFADSLYTMAAGGITGIEKDTTLGPVLIYGVDPVTSVQTLLVTLAPNENAPAFRRYFLDRLPRQCTDCPPPLAPIQMTAMAQLEFVPLTCDTDILLIGNLPAIKSEWMSLRFEGMDEPSAQQQAVKHHKDAIRYLQGEIVKYTGKQLPALGFKPFGKHPVSLNMR